MNFLAHVYLSFDNQEVAIGNFIADQIKGTNYEEFSPDIQKGIQLHRLIDEFTDSHPIYKKWCRTIFKDQGHYARVVVDILFDYFLAKNWSEYHTLTLEEFSADFYNLLESNRKILPERVLYMMPYMVTHNWFVKYRSLDGIDRILKGMHKRANYSSTMNTAVELISTYNDAFEGDFKCFFNELIVYSKKQG